MYVCMYIYICARMRVCVCVCVCTCMCAGIWVVNVTRAHSKVGDLSRG